MTAEAAERLEAELDLLHAMHPETLSFTPEARELRYSHYYNDKPGAGPPAVLLLRLPDTYPLDGFPEIISSTGHHKEDLRSATKAAFQAAVEAPAGEEVLDVLLLAFRDLVSSRESLQYKKEPKEQAKPGDNATVANNKTVVIWLHHLLNTNKRKLALNPSTPGAGLSGVTKPGYPGVLVYSGERSAVEAHVSELRSQRWQAFQVRYDADEVWEFKHGMSICEVESMSDVAQSITALQQRDAFLGAIGIK